MCWKILRKQLKEKHLESFIQERKERQYKRCITEQNFKIKLQFHCGTGIVSGYFAIDATVWGTMFIWDWITRTKINRSWKVCELNLSYNSRNQVNFWATPKNLRAWHFQWAIESAASKSSDQRLRYIGNTQKLRRFTIETEKEEFQNRRAQRGWLVGHICTRILQICFCCQTFFQCYWTKCNRLFSMEQLLKATKVLADILYLQ